MPFVTLVSLVLLGGVVGLLCFNTQMQQASFAAAELQDNADRLTAREQTLHQELQTLRDPQHVATLAVAAGMVSPESACTVKLADKSTTGTCTPATNLNTPALHDKAPAKPAALDPKPTVVTVEGAPTTDQAAGQGHHKNKGHRNKGRNAGRR
jgi:hypothetical protein